MPAHAMKRPRLRIALLLCLAVLPVACASTQPPAPISPVTKTVTAWPSPSSSAVAPAVPRRGATTALAADFRRTAATIGMPVGVAIAPVGGNAVPALSLGDQTVRVAWSTIKVPLALAAERVNGPSAAETAAIVNSDNASAEQLWASLGTPTEAAAAVTAVLREGGDQQTVVPAQQLRAGFTIFGQTQWALPDAATFTAHLPCLPGSAHVVQLMGQVAGNQQWGVEVMRTPASTAVKGGWGPGDSGGYLVRQIGLIRYRDGQSTAVTMSAFGGSMDGGIAALNALARWLDRHIMRLPRGRCG
ncbi:hypothetical protein AAFP30_20735 [Gordonia sp. CPCC 205515]|uniref:hypothetical protein n=1 Tax=Gordonia sp. CPCC 205515 TaxID=3140791 RepID=UPI003AF4025F